MRGPQSQIGLFMNVVNVELKLGDSLRPPDASLFPANPRNGSATRFEVVQYNPAVLLQIHMVGLFSPLH